MKHKQNEIPMFIRISQDTIVNVNEIKEINIYNSTVEFEEWLYQYNTAMDYKISQYFNNHNIDKTKIEPKELANITKKLKNEFDDELRKNIGDKPELIKHSYYISLFNNTSIQISDNAFNDICKIFNIVPNQKISKPTGSYLLSDASTDEYNDTLHITEIYNNL